ncbi:hypothetical protein LSCM1_07849 [Leishmania martiniquensis]|uniref:DUF866 domain-containing protein n=1 Tax=Leishmania martiniquensis TaxID=1580590 RepID=A0A836H477_9TRYP|nr:hypothetical protein LSCM1_07849 [Leishmania martiniquensis]
MPVFHAVMRVEESEGVERITPVKNRTWGLRFQCASCNEESSGVMYVNPNEQHDRDGGVHNFVSKCKLCKADITADVLSVPAGTGYYSAEEERAANVIAAFEVRGGRPVELEIDNQWTVVAAGGGTFEDVDLSEGWYDYDQGAATAVSITGVSVDFEKSKRR